MSPEAIERERERMRRRGSSSRRGYGGAHKALRAQVGRLVDAGEGVCARCGDPIVPGEPWDLGHLDGSGKTEYSGPEHRRCNRATAARKVQVSWAW